MKTNFPAEEDLSVLFLFFLVEMFWRRFVRRKSSRNYSLKEDGKGPKKI